MAKSNAQPPDRSANEFARTLKEMDKTLSQQREEHEKQLRDIRIKNELYISNLTKKQKEEIQNLDLELSKSVAQYQIQLRDKYLGLVERGEIKYEEMQKKIAQQVQDFIWVESQKRRAKEQTEEQQRIFDTKNAKLQADLDIHKKRIQLIKEQQELTLEDINTRKKAALSEYQQGKKTRKQYKDEKKKLAQEEAAARKKTARDMRKAGQTELEIMAETKKLSTEGIKEAVFSKETASAIGNHLINGLKQMFEQTIQTYGQYQQKVNTRLQGSGQSWQGNMLTGIGLGAYTGGIENTLRLAIGTNPYVKLQQVMDNVVKATEAGIANNIEQRAFLATVSENIAATFDAFDSNLMRVVRLQQADTTAARLGLEAGLTRFLNENFKDNSYLNNAFDTVSQNLLQTTSQLAAEEGVALEYTVQKWLGSLYSVGFGEDALGKISQALGYLGSGNISALSSDTELQNLIVMAASRANISYSDLLMKGLDSSNTNRLLQSMVNYLSEIAESDNKVVKSEYARIFGMSVADLKAVTNLRSEMTNITESMMSYGGAVNELYDQMGQLSSRISLAGMAQNMLENVKYSIASGIASNPITYALWEVTSMIEDLTGGINLPTVSVMGNMVDLNTTVTNLMRAGIVGASTLGSIGTIVSGVNSTISPSSMLDELGFVNGDKAKRFQTRGKGLSRKQRQIREQSQSSIAGNLASEDYYNESLVSADEQSNKLAEQKKQESTDISLNNIHEYLLSVFDPKITEIERFVALLAGVKNNDIAVSNWGQFQGENKTTYKGSVVDIKYTDENLTNKTQTLDNIKQNVASIYELLNDVVSGNKALTIKGDVKADVTSMPSSIYG